MRVGASGSTPDDLRARTSLSFAMARFLSSVQIVQIVQIVQNQWCTRGCLSAPLGKTPGQVGLAPTMATVVRED
jgi:hypothetical protein